MNRAFKHVVRQSSNLAIMQCSPKIISASEIRKSFIDYFCQDNHHLYIPSSSVFSLKDPTLAFTNAGMNQFKDIFLGLFRPEFNRAANYQKCIRIGGTLNDLDLVGQDGFHHTFFEMLGNWSFGDYFKEEACRMSWDLLTKVYNLPPERLYVTYFGGDKTLGLDSDDEVQEIWRKIGVKDSHILAFGPEHNFWSGSVIGPCGPCTEIHYDLCSGRTNAGALVNARNSEITELWNLVFIQYNRNENGELTKLRTRFVDTGMGFERLVAVLQGKTSNYDTDLFLPLFEIIKNHTGHSGYTGAYDSVNCSYRILADHSRMIAVVLSDGAVPSHQSKVRSIIKRALNTTEKIFHAKPHLLKELTIRVAQVLSDAYPKIEKNLPKIHYIIDHEVDKIEINKKKALNQWKKIKTNFPSLHDLNVTEIPQITASLGYISRNILEKGKLAFSGEDIFVLHDTYGLPVHKAEEIALKLGLKFNLDDFKHYELSKKSSEKKEIHQKYLDIRKEFFCLELISKLEEKNIQPTKDYFKYDYRVDGEGKYIFENQPTTIEAIVCDNNLMHEISAEDIKEGQETALILDRTQLFSEEGGQESDCGTLEIENEIIFDIKKVIKAKDFVIHFGSFRDFPSNAKVAVQNLGVIKLDEEKRLNVMRNHTALHLVNAFLREELYVTGEKFSEISNRKRAPLMPVKETFELVQLSPTANVGIKKLEKYVKDFINHGVSVKREILNPSQFHSLENVLFIPGETLLSREIPVIEINSGFKLSREYCTGTHVLHVSDLQDFVVMSYVKGSYHVNKIEAVTGEKCLQVKKADSEVKEKWRRFEEEISKCGQYGPFEVKDLFGRIAQFSSETSNSDAISYLTKFTIKSAIKEAEKSYSLLKQLAVRNYLEEELRKVISETTEKFIVHSFESCWEFSSYDLENAAVRLEEKPLFVLFNGKDSTSVQCVVPQAFVSQKFSADKWLIDSLVSLGGGIAMCHKDQNPDLLYFLADRKITEAQSRRIIETAIYLARRNIES